MTKAYTGIGSRETPGKILTIMENLAMALKTQGWTLRSGGAKGADSAFERGAGSSKQIFYASDATQAAMEIAQKSHPAWHRCSEYARKLHARNAFQVLGSDLKTPSRFVVCWTPDGASTHANRSIITGGTGTAISIAEPHSIPIFNLCNNHHLAKIEAFIAKSRT